MFDKDGKSVKLFMLITLQGEVKIFLKKQINRKLLTMKNGALRLFYLLKIPRS